MTTTNMCSNILVVYGIVPPFNFHCNIVSRPSVFHMLLTDTCLYIILYIFLKQTPKIPHLADFKSLILVAPSGIPGMLATRAFF